MRLPSMNAKIQRTATSSVALPQTDGAGMILAASLSCYQRCAGSAATACSSCGGDADCWNACAGPGVGACISRCTPTYF